MENYFCIEGIDIKAPEGQKVIKSSAYRAYLEASELLVKTEASAIKIIEAGNAVYSDQNKQGYEEGIEEGKKSIAWLMTDVATEAAVFKQKIEGQIVDTIVVVLKNIFEKIGDDNLLRQIVTKTLRSYRNQKEITIRVCPAQKEKVESVVEKMQKLGKLRGFIEIVGDISLDRGRCMVHTEFASVDVGIDVQLHMIKTLLFEHISRYKK